jgi:hypothetical protein
MPTAAAVGAGCAFSPSVNWQFQHAGVEDAFSFSGQSLCMWPPPHHKQPEGGVAVGPDVAKLLAVITLRKGVLGFIIL